MSNFNENIENHQRYESHERGVKVRHPHLKSAGRAFRIMRRPDSQVQNHHHQNQVRVPDASKTRGFGNGDEAVARGTETE
jgi:hypothetical protein